ncbi:MAG: hypothetical protein WC919_02875 [Candidatus Paceibacterota bacterium]|jgi:hypothetical protein
MLDHSINAPLKAAQGEKIQVWFDGTTAVLEGQAVCFEYDYNAPATPAGAAQETAASADFRRSNYVKLPSATNGNHFAGVSSAYYPASSVGQFITIYTPGSTCKVLTKASLTIGVGIVTFQCGGTYAGYFRQAGFEGQGSAVPLQTLNTSSTAALTVCRLQTGNQSGGVESLTPTGTAGGALQSKVGGVTFYEAATNTSAVLTSTLADGTILGERKMFVINGTQTTNGVTLTVTTGFKLDGTTSITTITGNTAARRAYFEWRGNAWYTLCDTFDTIA